ncbi:HD domain-containing protein [Streptomyces bambusae]|uniref:HD domain-containing protein n=1 Tax=Streptomyces bambusae TaxID=1550616 RepID=A0ABS6Z497_9ACTN|nr:HD domain-containing protein [Streptomyces bambusae]MBW5482590.1 HD domain-containing protein [Streptomyces bambusae]
MWQTPGRAAGAARELAAEYADEALLNHSVRSYAFGAEYARAHGLAFDEELLYVAALLHDLGLTAPFDSHTLPFEEAGGHVARALTTGLGWPAARRARAAEVIVLHMREDVTAAEDVESHLLQVGTSADVSGLRVPEFDPSFVESLLTAHPRLGFGASFLSLMQSQATRKPDCAAAHLIEGGVATRIARNPLDRAAG